MKWLAYITAAFLLAPAAVFAQGISQLDQWRGTTTPFTAIAPQTHGKDIYAPFSDATTTSLTTSVLCLTSDTCRTTWPSGTLSGSGTQGQAAYWTSSSALGGVATGSLSATGPLSVTAGRAVFGGNAAFTITQSGAAADGYLSSTDWNIFNNKISSTSLSATSPLSYNSSSGVFTIDTSGTWSGNAGTATALAGNGTNAAAGSAILGIDASGNAEGAFDVWTEAENTAAAYTPQSRALTVAGTANQITSSAGSQDLSTDRTWTLSLAGPHNFTTLSGLLQGNGTSAITGITGTAGQLPYYNGTNTLLATSTLFISTASNVGIGTTSPDYKLQIAGFSATIFDAFKIRTTQAAASGVGSRIVFAESSNAAVGMITSQFDGSNWILQLGTNDSNPTLTLKNAAVGIGVANATQKLEVQGTASSTDVKVKGNYLARLAQVFSTSTPGINSQIVFTGAVNSTCTHSAGVITCPSNTAYFEIELNGGGGGSGGGGNGGDGGNGGNGGESCFGTNSTACTSPSAQAYGGNGGTGGQLGVTNGSGGAPGSASAGDLQLSGGGGSMGIANAATNGNGGSAARGGGGGYTCNNCGGAAGGAFGGGASGGSYAGGGGGGAAYAYKLVLSPSGTYYYTIGVGGTAGTAGTGGSAGAAGGSGGMKLSVYLY